ncbi:hypothetical protein RUND412_004695 [Rhizina undulata]
MAGADLEALGGLLLTLCVFISLTQTSAGHITNLTDTSSTLDERNAMLYLTMRFAYSFRKITNFQLYHVGDRVNVEDNVVMDDGVGLRTVTIWERVAYRLSVEVDVVLDEGVELRNNHDLGESFTYVLECLDGVDIAYFVWNILRVIHREELEG